MKNSHGAKSRKISRDSSLPSHDSLFALADSCVTALESESADYRPRAKNGECGALLDFTKSEPLPLVVVPDLHARLDFFARLLGFVLPENFIGGPGVTVESALGQKILRVVCVGDILHSEARGRERWQKAWIDFSRGVCDGPAMTEEMSEGFGLLAAVMECKRANPEFFHILKGNHENITNKRGGGDFPFCKFTDEGQMTTDFARAVYGDDILHLVSCFERALPLAAAFPNCVVSHAEPQFAMSRERIINARSSDEDVRALTWTANDEADDGSVRSILDELCGGADGAVYIAGHRPVRGAFALRQGGKFVQIHNPDREQIALVRAGGLFNPSQDIVAVS